MRALLAELFEGCSGRSIGQAVMIMFASYGFLRLGTLAVVTKEPFIVFLGLIMLLCHFVFSVLIASVIAGAISRFDEINDSGAD